MKLANGRTVPDIDVDVLTLEYRQIGYLSKLAVKYGCTRWYITKLLRENGVQTTSQKESARSHKLKNKNAVYPTKEELERLYVQEHYSYNAIAKMFGLSYSAIHRLRIEYKLPSEGNVQAWKNRRPDADAKWRESLSRSSKGKKNSMEAREKLSKTRSERLANGTIKNAHGFFKYGTQMTKKSGKQHFDSSYERVMFDILDACPSVVSWTKNHKIVIPYPGKNGLVKNHVPDFLINWKDGSVTVYEVKPFNLIDFRNNPRKILAAAMYCQERGYLYGLITELELGLDSAMRPLPDWAVRICTDTHTHLLNPVPASASSR